MIQHHTADLGGVNIHYAEAPGGGRPLLLLHGITGSHDTYVGLIPELAKTWHVYAPDLRGHGVSSHVPGSYHVSDYARDVTAFIHEVVREPVAIAGHSLGAMTALWVGAHTPEAVRGIFAEDPPLYITQMPRLKGTEVYSFFRLLRDSLLELASAGTSVDDIIDLIGQWPAADGQSNLEAHGREGLRGWATVLQTFDPHVLDPAIEGVFFDAPGPDAVLEMISCPVHLLAGQWALGGTMNEADVQRMVARTSRCTYRVLDNVGHQIHAERADEYLAELTQFLRTLPPHAE